MYIHHTRAIKELMPITISRREAWRHEIDVLNIASKIAKNTSGTATALINCITSLPMIPRAETDGPK